MLILDMYTVKVTIILLLILIVILRLVWLIYKEARSKRAYLSILNKVERFDKGVQQLVILSRTIPDAILRDKIYHILKTYFTCEETHKNGM